MMTRSHEPTSFASVVACRRIVRSPDAPSNLNPFARIASTCVCQESIAHISWPAAPARRGPQPLLPPPPRGPAPPLFPLLSSLLRPLIPSLCLLFGFPLLVF